MRKLYLLFFVAACLSACGVSVNYLGNSFEKTSQVDVFVDASAIKRKYTIVGKGYEQRLPYGVYNIEKVQEKAVAKARQKGADAILFQDYYLVQPGTTINTTVRTDTLNKAVVTTGQTYAGPVVSSGRHILFLKYE